MKRIYKALADPFIGLAMLDYVNYVCCQYGPSYGIVQHSLHDFAMHVYVGYVCCFFLIVSA